MLFLCDTFTFSQSVGQFLTLSASFISRTPFCSPSWCRHHYVPRFVVSQNGQNASCEFLIKSMRPNSVTGFGEPGFHDGLGGKKDREALATREPISYLQWRNGTHRLAVSQWAGCWRDQGAGQTGIGETGRPHPGYSLMC